MATRDDELKNLVSTYIAVKSVRDMAMRQLDDLKRTVEQESKKMEDITKKIMGYVGNNQPIRHVLIEGVLVTIKHPDGISVYTVIQ